jgi:Xaa-Pro aminopeptidase
MKKIFDFLPNNTARFLCGTLDEFLNENNYYAINRLKQICGFTGSTGILIIEKEGKSAFFTDGRYKLQASIELDKEKIEIFDLSYLENYLCEKEHVTLDGKFHSVPFILSLEKKGIKVCLTEGNPMGQAFNLADQDIKSENYEFKLAGENKEDKFKRVFEVLDKEKCEGMFIFNPHHVCWLFNLRGNFLQNTPLVNSFAFVSRETQFLLSFKDISKIKCKNLLTSKHISMYIYLKLKTLCENIMFSEEEYIENWKSIKTSFEIECIKRAHTEDGKVLKEFIKWIKSTSLEGETEYSIGEKLLDIRRKRKGFIGESFPSIVGFQENGAIIHYRAKKGDAKQITEGILLIDSGGQYYDEEEKICGTTDVTRVILIGAPEDFQKRMYTLVLKGNLALESAIFPEGTPGAALDILARQFLFKEGYNYNHGTGHGVGYFLSVHEGPCGISKNYHTPLKEGMIVSNEPGVYLEGKFGIRIENLLLVKKAPDIEGFLMFESLTKVEIEKSLLDYEILTDSEIARLTSYHKYLNESIV